MPFALAIIGIMIFVTAIRGTTSTLFALIKDDFTGNGNFIYWVLSILVIGSVGYVKRFQPIANAFLALVMIVLLIGAGNKGFFAQFMAGIKTPATNCGGGASPNSTENLLAKQATDFPAPVQYQPGQSLQQQLNNTLQNLNSAFGTSSTLGGG